MLSSEAKSSRVGATYPPGIKERQKKTTHLLLSSYAGELPRKRRIRKGAGSVQGAVSLQDALEKRGFCPWSCFTQGYIGGKGCVSQELSHSGNKGVARLKKMCLPRKIMSKSLKKIVEESREKNVPEVDMCDRGISNLLDIPGLFTLSHITQLVLSHNKLSTIPPNIADLKNLEVLNVFNNQIEELPTQLSSLQKLKHLNLGMNRLSSLPRGFGSLPALEVLDLTYNNLNESSLPGNFFYLTTLRALYLSDNDFEILPPDIGKLTKLQILSLRDNDLISLPKEIGDLAQLKELHIQGNRLTVLPPELGNLDLTGPKQVFKAENNPWVTPIYDQFQLGVSHVFEYVRSETYKYLYGRHMQANPAPPKKSNDKSKKISRKPLAAKNK
uniref:Ras suppressor protein 1 n=4 Tax=Scleropages formosus TaxID=113540 RepID=A0A8C9RJZ6_SCLFO